MAAGLSAAMRRLGLVEGMDLAIDAALAQAPGDELGHLTAEIDDQDGGVAGGRHGGDLGENGRILHLTDGRLAVRVAA